MLSTQLVTIDKKEILNSISNDDDALNNLHIDRSFITSTKDNVAASIDNQDQHIPDKLHRRNPVTVRQEIQFFDDLIPETTLADLQLSEMPGLQNTEQWKRIATRIGQTSPPLSRQYRQTATCIFESQNGHIPDVFGSYRRPGRTENEQNFPSVAPSLLQTSRRKIFFCISIIAIMIVIIIAVIVAVVLVRKPSQQTTDYYSGSIFVRARFDPILISSSSTLVKNYQREFCSLIGTTLADAKTKYAIFYSDCTVNNFRNGSIISDFLLGFTRYQNVTRLNAFLNRTLVNKQLFGGTILSITFNSTTDIYTNDTDYDNDYNEKDSINLLSINKQNQEFLIKNSNEQIRLRSSEMIRESFETNNNLISTKPNSQVQKILFNGLSSTSKR